MSPSYSPKCRSREFKQQGDVSCSCLPPRHLGISPYLEWDCVSILLGKCLISAYYVLVTVLATMCVKSLLPPSVIGDTINLFYR